MNNIIEISGLNQKYNGKYILNNLNLNIPIGSICGLLGKNGSGKTTLIKCILGLINHSNGRIKVLSDSPCDFKETTKERIGYVPQSDKIYPWLKIIELINYTASFYKNWNNELVKDLLNQWELDKTKKIGILSEGQVQKLLIILALGHEPDLLIFDEPVASLDPSARRNFLKTILKITSKKETTIFFSTHITSDLERIADKVALLKEGSIDFSGDLDQLKDEVKKLKITSDTCDLNNLKIDGLLSFESLKNEAIITIRGFDANKKNQIESDYNAKVDVIDLNLEEIFLEITK